MKCFRVIVIALAALVAVPAVFAEAALTAPSPGVVAGGFCTYGKGNLANSTQAAQRINTYFAAGAVGSEIFHVGNVETPTDDPSTYAYTWKKTGTLVPVGKGSNTVQVDSGVAALQHAITGGQPGAFSTSATNPTDMGTGGILGTQALVEKVNQGFSEVFVTPATGFSGLSFVDMDGLKLDGVRLTRGQADALNGQATLQLREAADAALGGGPLPYGLSYAQLTDLIDLVNGSFESCAPSRFAQAHLYQPYVTSNAFASDEKRPSTVSTFASKPTYNTFSGDVVPVSPDATGHRLGCTEASYANFPASKIALIERGGCTFYVKLSVANAAGASAAIIYNSEPAGGCPPVPVPGQNNCEALVGMGAATGSATLPIPAAFVQRSTGMALLGGGTGSTAFVQQ